MNILARITENPVPAYMWPHLDFGREQASCLNANYEHGQVVEVKGRNATFRLVDREYDKEWQVFNLPNMKAYWKVYQALVNNQKE